MKQYQSLDKLRKSHSDWIARKKANHSPTKVIDLPYKKKSTIEKMFSRISSPPIRQPITEITYKQGLELFHMILKVHLPDYQYTEEQKHIIAEMIKYFMNIPGIYNLKKGFYITGPHGTGKSTLMRLFAEFNHATKQNKYKIINYKTLFEKIRSKGMSAFSPIEKYQDKYINDLGFINSSSINSYSNKIDLVQSIISVTYDQYESRNIRTHFTSNIPLIKKSNTIETMEERYGIGIAQRIPDYCNIIIWKGKNHRPK